MRKLRQAFLTAAWRGFKGMVVGAVMAGVVAVAGSVSLLGPFALTAYDPKDRADYLQMLGAALQGSALVGILIGSIAGLASRLPRKGVGMLPSIGIVGGCAALLPAVFTISHQSKSGTPYAMLAAIGAIVGGVIVLVYGAADKPAWCGVGLRYARSVFRWVVIAFIATAILWLCYSILGLCYGMGDKVWRPVSLPRLIVCICLTAGIAYICKWSSITMAASPFIAAFIAIACIGNSKVVPLEESGGLGFLIGLLVILVPFGGPAKPKQDVNPPSTTG